MFAEAETCSQMLAFLLTYVTHNESFGIFRPSVFNRQKKKKSLITRENEPSGELLARVPWKEDISNKTITLRFRDITPYSLTTKCLCACAPPYMYVLSPSNLAR